MQRLRLPTLALGTVLLLACGTTAPQITPPKHLRQSARQLNLANKHFIKGCYRQAFVEYQRAHERYTAADHISGVAHSLNGIANVYYRMDEPSSAISTYDDALEAYGMINDQAGVVRTLCNKAAALITTDQLDAAEGELKKSDALVGNHSAMRALHLKTRAMLKMQQGKLKDAEMVLQMAIDAANKSAPGLLSSTSYTMGQLLLMSQKPSRAIAFFEKSLSIDQTTGAYDDIAHDLAALGRCHEQLEQRVLAAAHYKRSIKIYGLLGNADKVKALATRLADLGRVEGVTIPATLQWVSLWLEGQKEANLCR